MAMVLARRPSRVVQAFRRASPVVTRTRTKLVRVGGRVGRAVYRKALDRKHKIAAVGTAFAVGWLKKEGNLDKFPHIDKLGVLGTYGLGLAFAGEYFKSATMDHISTGLLAIAAYQWGSGEDVSGEGDGYTGGMTPEDLAGLDEGPTEGDDGDIEQPTGAAADIG